ncbi:MAG: hypothetical protein ACKVU0_13900 [Saprospiraceae bacterium]
MPSKTNCIEKNPLQRDGTHQLQRTTAALQPETVGLEQRSVSDWLKYFSNLSRGIRFYDPGDAPGAEGTKNWRPFFPQISEADLQAALLRSDNEPHRALLLAFLHLYKHAQDDFNNLPRRHLDFYYQQVLRMALRPPHPDKVHLVFEPARGLTQHLIEKDTLLDAGKDSLGQPLLYKTTDDLLMNTATVAELRSVFRKNGPHIAPVANSADGQGTPFEEGQLPAWPAFGHEGLPAGRVGFALASPMLLLKEGKRTVTLPFVFDSPVAEDFSESDLKTAFQVFATGESGWLGPFVLSSASVQKNNNKLLSGITLEFMAPAGAEALTPYVEFVHLAGFNTHNPLVRLELKPNPEGHRVWHGLKNASLKSLQIKVDVEGIKDLQVENDLTQVDASKPFLPFGPIPHSGSSCYIGSREALSKNPKEITLEWDWMNLPTTRRTEMDGASGKFYIWKDQAWGDQISKFTLFDKPGFSVKWPQKATVVSQISAQLAEVYLVASPTYQIVGGINPMLPRSRVAVSVVAPLQVAAALTTVNPIFHIRLRDNFLRLSIDRKLGHDLYPEELADHYQDKEAYPKKPLQPYTPLAQNIRLHYQAETRGEPMTSGAELAVLEQNYLSREVQFFHLAPFGQKEEHPFLRKSLPFATQGGLCLLPYFPNEGELYIGLKNAEARRTVTLFFLLAEGTANPDKINDDQRLVWSVLCLDTWKELDQNAVLSDSSQQWLNSGIVRIALPPETSTDNTLLPSGFVWLRAAMKSDTDAACQVLGIFTQAVEAEFVIPPIIPADRLDAPLPAGIIQKLVNRQAEVKKVLQPGASFGGRPLEKPEAYYTRVSERLRHRNRAIGIWDYERLVLEQFPEIAKVRCLNHSSDNQELVPGAVSLVVVPVLDKRSGPSLLTPRTDAPTLARIRDFLKSRISPWIELFVQNPDFEEVKLDFRVKMHPKFEADFGFYRRALNQALVAYLSPWVARPDLGVHFGGNVHKSVVWNFLENHPFVDFITEIRMVRSSDPNKDLDEITPSSSRAILVSAAEHDIKPTTS